MRDTRAAMSWKARLRTLESVVLVLLAGTTTLLHAQQLPPSSSSMANVVAPPPPPPPPPPAAAAPPAPTPTTASSRLPPSAASPSISLATPVATSTYIEVLPTAWYPSPGTGTAAAPRPSGAPVHGGSYNVSRAITSTFYAVNGSTLAALPAPTPTASAAAAPPQPTTAGTQTPPPPSPPADSADAHDALPLKTRVDASLGILGAILLPTGGYTAFVGARVRWTLVATAGFYWLSLTALCLILKLGVARQVRDPSDTLRGLFLLGCLCSGTVGSILFIVFSETAVLLTDALGGFALALFLQAVKSDGLIGPIGLRWVLYVGLASVSFTLGVWRRASHLVLVVASAIIGATALLLGIDCFTRAGLKEFYVRNLGFDELFEARHYPTFAEGRWPLVTPIQIELGVLGGATLMATAFQLRVWSDVKKNFAALRTGDEDRRFRRQASSAARHVFATAQRELQEWEHRHGYRRTATATQQRARYKEDPARERDEEEAFEAQRNVYLAPKSPSDGGPILPTYAPAHRPVSTFHPPPQLSPHESEAIAKRRRRSASLADTLGNFVPEYLPPESDAGGLTTPSELLERPLRGRAASMIELNQGAGGGGSSRRSAAVNGSQGYAATTRSGTDVASELEDKMALLQEIAAIRESITRLRSDSGGARSSTGTGVGSGAGGGAAAVVGGGHHGGEARSRATSLGSTLARLENLDFHQPPDVGRSTSPVHPECLRPGVAANAAVAASPRIAPWTTSERDRAARVKHASMASQAPKISLDVPGSPIWSEAQRQARASEDTRRASMLARPTSSTPPFKPAKARFEAPAALSSGTRAPSPLPQSHLHPERAEDALPRRELSMSSHLSTVKHGQLRSDGSVGSGSGTASGTGTGSGGVCGGGGGGGGGKRDQLGTHVESTDASTCRRFSSSYDARGTASASVRASRARSPTVGGLGASPLPSPREAPSSSTPPLQPQRVIVAGIPAEAQLLRNKHLSASPRLQPNRVLLQGRDADATPRGSLDERGAERQRRRASGQWDVYQAHRNPAAATAAAGVVVGVGSAKEKRRSLAAPSPTAAAAAPTVTMTMAELQARHQARLSALQRPATERVREEAALQDARRRWETKMRSDRLAWEKKRQAAAGGAAQHVVDDDDDEADDVFEDDGAAERRPSRTLSRVATPEPVESRRASGIERAKEWRRSLLLDVDPVTRERAKQEQQAAASTSQVARGG